MKRGFSGNAYDLVQEPSQLTVSPSGLRAVYTVRSMSTGQDRYRTDLWLADPGEGAVRRLTGGGSDHSPLWLDDETVLFSSGREAGGGEETVFYRIGIYGGEAEAYLRIPLAGAKVTPLG